MLARCGFPKVCLSSAAQVAKRGGNVLFVDCKNSFCPHRVLWFLRNNSGGTNGGGTKVSDRCTKQPPTLEESNALRHISLVQCFDVHSLMSVLTNLLHQHQQSLSQSQPQSKPQQGSSKKAQSVSTGNSSKHRHRYDLVVVDCVTLLLSTHSRCRCVKHLFIRGLVWRLVGCRGTEI